MAILDENENIYNDNFERCIRSNKNMGSSAKHFLLEPFILPPQLQYIGPEGQDIDQNEHHDIDVIKVAMTGVSPDDQDIESDTSSNVSREIRQKSQRV